MFTDLNQWFASFLDEGDDQLSAVKLSVGVLLYHIIDADNRHSKKELDRFSEVFTRKFDEPQDSIALLFDRLARLNGTLGFHAEIIKHHLEKDGQNPLGIMTMLNEMINIDGIDEREYRVFSEIEKKFV